MSIQPFGFDNAFPEKGRGSKDRKQTLTARLVHGT